MSSSRLDPPAIGDRRSSLDNGLLRSPDALVRHGPEEGPNERTPVTDGPLIVQSDKTLLLEVAHPDAPAARANIAPFASSSAPRNT